MTIPPPLQHYPPQSTYLPPPRSKGLAIAAAAVGGAALLFSWVPVFGLLLGLAAGVLGIVGIMKSVRGLSIAGLAMGGLGILINVIVLTAVAATADDAASTSSRFGTIEPTTAATTAPTAEPTTDEPTTEPTTEAPATTEPTGEPTLEPTTEPPAPVYRTPKAADFALTVKTTSKHCFGSAGCNIEYRVKVALKSSVNLDPDKSYDVTFDVLGGEDGPVTGTFTLEEDGTYSGYDLDGFLSTSSSGKKLTAKVTDVEEN